MREINTHARNEEIILAKLDDWVNIQELILLGVGINEVYQILGKLLMQGNSFEVRVNEKVWEGEIRLKGEEE